MKLWQYWQSVGMLVAGSVAGSRRTQRKGQIAMNLLSDVRPDLADKVRGTDLDPFYVDARLDDKFAKWLEENW